MEIDSTISLESIKSTSDQNELKFIIAIDPGSGVSSPTGLTITEINSKSILVAKNLFTKHSKVAHRLKDISDQFELELLEFLSCLPDKSSVLICIESFVMWGKGGETLQRLIGSLISRIPISPKYPLVEVQNTRVKLVIGGHGHADKIELAKGLLPFFAKNKDSIKLITQLTEANEFDIIDSLSIGVTGWLQESGILPEKLKKKRKPSIIRQKKLTKK